MLLHQILHTALVVVVLVELDNQLAQHTHNPPQRVEMVVLVNNTTSLEHKYTMPAAVVVVL